MIYGIVFLATWLFLYLDCFKDPIQRSDQMLFIIRVITLMLGTVLLISGIMKIT